jgi:CheY-like chemotaxis protein
MAPFKILLVDDNPVDHALAIHELKKEFGDLLPADRIALLFLDTVMPRKNGRETYDEIWRANPWIKVLFTSGYRQEISDVLKAEGQRFIAKPIVPTKLLQAVREVLDAS